VLQTEGESNALKFSQVFHLMPVNSSFVVTNGEQRLDPGALAAVPVTCSDGDSLYAAGYCMRTEGCAYWYRKCMCASATMLAACLRVAMV
jgi:hypothetical protein